MSSKRKNPETGKYVEQGVYSDYKQKFQALYFDEINPELAFDIAKKYENLYKKYWDTSTKLQKIGEDLEIYFGKKKVVKEEQKIEVNIHEQEQETYYNIQNYNYIIGRIVRLKRDILEIEYPTQQTINKCVNNFYRDIAPKYSKDTTPSQEKKNNIELIEDIKKLFR